MPSMQTRRAPQCTHPTMSILYGGHSCTHCNRPSRLGWVYSCTHDDHNHGDTTKHEEEINASMKGLGLKGSADIENGEEKVSLEAVKLKPWMEKAILQGIYTSDQVRILQAQREKVTRVIAAEERVSTRYIKQASGPPQFIPLHMAPICEANLPLAANQDVEEAEVKEPLVAEDPVEVPKLVPACTYKACQVCRPGSRDRAWQRISGVPAPAVTSEAPDSSVESRRISDANVVRCLGLHKSNLQHDSMTLFHTSEEQDQDLPADEDRITDDAAPENTEAESEYPRFIAMKRRAGTRSIIRSMMARPREDSKDSRGSAESNSSGKLVKKRNSVRASVVKKYMEKFGLDLGEPSEFEGEGPIDYKSWKDNGRSAAKMEKEGRESGLRSSDVALTKEAVDLGNAEIIMQA